MDKMWDDKLNIFMVSEVVPCGVFCLRLPPRLPLLFRFFLRSSPLGREVGCGLKKSSNRAGMLSLEGPSIESIVPVMPR